MSFSAGFRKGSFLVMLSRVAQALAATVTVLVICLPLFSQGSLGTIQGGVFDQSGGAVAGATVSVIDVARGVTRRSSPTTPVSTWPPA